tara:strand:- start:15840 stop:16073 length:234 start_codon:yes stop_codon:yes gene_type:complete
MSEENEMLMLLKELVDKVKALESAVYDKDNMLMKSGLVVVNSPTPSMSNNATPTADTIKNMDWKDINNLVSKIEGKI